MTTTPTPTPTPTINPWWGIRPPEGTPVAWGARAIVDSVRLPVLTRTGRVKREGGQAVTRLGYAFGLMPDRQAWQGPETLCAALARAMPEMIRRLEAAYYDQYRGYSEVEVDAQVGPWRGTVRARAVGDYAYIGAWTDPDEAGWETGVWSGTTAIPALGDRVRVRVNGLGPGTVIRRRLVHGYAGVEVVLDDPPEWYVKQNGALASAVAFGVEVEPLPG